MVIVLVGHGSSVVIIVEVEMVELFILESDMACAQKKSRYTSTHTSQVAAFTLQPA